MVGATALVTGVSAVFVGSLLLRTWLGHGGDSGTSHFRRIQILSHAAVEILGVILMVVHSQPAGYIGGRGPRSVVVNYAVTEGQILFLVPAYNEITQYVPGKQVTFQVAGKSSGPAPRYYGTVSVTGTANLPGLEQAPIVRRTNFVELWPPDVTTSVICLPMAKLEGSERLLIRG
jgi:hypothetical protein